MYREGWQQQFFSLDVFRLSDEGCSGKTKCAAARALCFDVKEQVGGREEEGGGHGCGCCPLLHLQEGGAPKSSLGRGELQECKRDCREQGGFHL
jgi:hypothetical protein